MNQIEISLNNCESVTLLVTYTYSYDRGVHTFSNGDPGYPESEEISIEKIEVLGEKFDLLDVLDNYTSSEIIEEIKNKISNYER